MILIFLFLQIFFSLEKSQAYPYKCTITIALVLELIFFKTSSIFITRVAKLISAQINFAPFLANGIAEAQ